MACWVRVGISGECGLRRWCVWAGSGAREIFGLFGLGARFGGGDHVALDQIGQILVEGLHAERLAGLDHGIHLRNLVFANEVANGRRADHDFVRGHPARAVFFLAERLRNHAYQRFRQHGAHHFLFFRREHVNDTVDGLGRRRGVQGGEHQVAGFGSGKR